MVLPFDVDDPLLARAAWSRIAEPGDAAASGLVQAVGPSEALRWLAAPHGGGPALGGAAPGEEAPQGPAAAARAKWAPRLDGLDPRRELRALALLGGRLLTPDCPGWPKGLRDLGNLAPICLWALGAPETVETLGARLTASAAVVGSRASTAYGETVTAQLVAELVGRGVAVVSGGAFGVDAAAHRAALGCGGFTVAVMAGGVDRLYPAGNERLLRAVVAQGAVVSEVPPGGAPRRERFLSRNRLIAAMTNVTVVTESGWRSGSHRTARDAAQLMRPVGAVPGPVTSASSAGCHKLVREGVATLVTGASAVIELMAPLGSALFDDRAAAPGALDGLGAPDRQVFDALPKVRAATVSALVTASGLSAAATMAALARLERAGRAAENGGLWRRLRQVGDLGT
ncbi:MAG: DNA-protecting protein DprA [Bifidobacteriaceae bacterium]|jgi:DNA processing protein|nr:DNA-protecting protein DprA [Bifidobacteriaceae bacterium]